MIKSSVQRLRCPATCRVLTSILVLLAVFGSAGTLYAQAGGAGFDPAKVNVQMVPADRWGTLEPTAILGDSSWWNFGSTPTDRHPFWHDVDIENGWVFSTTGRGLQIHNASSTPGSPPRTAYFFASTRTVPDWHQNDTKFYLFGVDAPAGYDGVAAVAAISDNGMLIFDTRNKELPRLMYQDNAKSGTQVWANTYGNTHYAFFAATNKRVLIYNMSAAQGLSATCLDESPVLTSCMDSQNRKVYVGSIATQTGASYLHGAGDYLAVSQGSLGVEIWKVNEPTAPQRVLKFAPPGQTYGVALWKEGSKYYLAVVQGGNAPPRYLNIYDVSCVASGGCTAGTKIGEYQMNHVAPTATLFVTFSRAGQTPFLYLGAEDQFSGGPQREYLLDVSNPTNPVEVTPQGHASGYWGWYYWGNPTGYNWVMPRTAKFYGNYLYRAAFGLFDVHQYKGNLPPAAAFTYSPATIYAGDPVTFTDRSTGNPTSWSWSFSPDGSPATSSTASPAGVTFPTTGTKNVTLSINGGASTKVEPLTVYNPIPAVGNVSAVPAAPKVCQRVSFTGENITGKPTISYSWQIVDANNNPLPGVSGTTTALDWNTQGTPAGTYTARLTASNASGSGVGSVTFNLENPGALPATGTFLPTNDVFTGGTVQFHLPAGQADSASEWQWDFGDGTVTAWNSDPVTGPNPTHTYTAIGSYQVKVSVRNCVDLGGKTSAALPVTIVKLIDLKAEFSATCPFGFCSFGVGEQIPFMDASTGATRWDYDWNGDGTFEDANRTSPVTSHAYTAVGKYRPKLQVYNGTTPSAVYQLAQELNIVQTGPPPTARITVTGPSTGKIATNATFEATAANCSGSVGSTGWSWQTDGGTISGSSNTQSISVSWASTGSKTVRATHSSCGSTSGSKSIAISNDGGGGGNPGTLKANFTYAPSPVLQNQATTFNGSSSTGNPTAYTWDFGDGTSGSGAQVSHTFTQKGTFVVKLTVIAPGNCAPATFCENATQQAIVIGNGAPTLAASFNSEICIAELSFVLCATDSGKEVTFTDASSGDIVSRTWDFGDGETATGTSVKHTYKRSGTFPLTLTVSDGTSSVSYSHPIIVNGGGPVTEAMVLPWIAKTVDGALVQSSDFYLHNPSTREMKVSLEFRRRGTPEENPPRTSQPIPIAPNATLFSADVVKTLFNREDVTGFLNVTVDEGDVQPVVTSFNTTFQDDGSEFGQTIPGYLLSDTGAASSTGNNQVQHLVGLSDNDERFAYFGLSNPSGDPVAYRLRFFNNLGQEIGTASQPITLSRYGAKQYQVKDIRTLFGISDKDDYRVVVESDKGAPLFPYAANLRLSSNDPSFVSVGAGASRVYLLGALSTPGPNNSLWQSDVVIANTSSQVTIVELTFTGVGAATDPTDTITETLQPGETRRLADVIGTKWNIRNAVGVLTIDSDAPGSLFPLVQGESYDNTNPAKRFGQTLPALADKQAAGLTQGQYLVGLRQDAKYRTTFWVFNPGTQNGEYEVVYRAINGDEIDRIPVTLGAGKVRQFNAGGHPAGAAGSFTVQVIVKKGKALAAAQVVNNRTNDPAYIQGETR